MEPAEITPGSMLEIISYRLENGQLKGLAFKEFQTFVGEKRQCFKTVIVFGGKEYLTYHARPFSFIITGNGRLRPRLLISGPSRYHPT